jgi:Glycosyltransferase family 87
MGESDRRAFPSASRRPAREGIWRWRIEVYGLALVAVYAVLFAGLYKSGWWIFKDTGKPILADFTPMWLAGRQALAGHAAAAYDLKAFVAAQKALVGLSKFYYPWPYPPMFFLPSALVALIPYGWAFVIWEAATLSLLLWVIYSIIPERAAVIATLASPLIVFNLAVGQNGTLTAALIGGALLLLERRPLAAGCLIGCLSYKPQFAFVLPLALAASGRWRALAAAAGAAALLAVISLLAFGPEVWQAFPAALSHRASSALVAHIPSGKIQSLYALLRHFGVGATAAWGLQIAVSLVAVGSVLLLWRGTASYSLRAAGVAQATLIAPPYLFAYDMLALLIATAFLVADAIARGSSRSERLALGALYVAQFAYVPLSDHPLGFFLNLALFALILWRAWGNRYPASVPRIAPTGR